MVETFNRHEVRFDPRLAGCSRFVRQSDHADLERQIAELQAELATANADRCFHTDDDPNCKLESTFMRMVDAARAENTRLRALPLKDEVGRVLEPLDSVHVTEDGWCKWTEIANAIDEARRRLSRLRAGVQEGEPTDDEIYRDGHLRGCRMCASDGIGQNCTCGFEEWQESPAAPSDQGGDRG